MHQGLVRGWIHRHFERDTLGAVALRRAHLPATEGTA